MTNAISKLREETGAGIMDCKRALDGAGGDYNLAKAILEKQGAVRASQKAERSTGAGLLEAYVHNNRVGVLLELRSETDFVAYSEPVKELAHNLVLQIASMAPVDVADLLKQPYVKDESRTVEAIVNGVVAIVGENLKVSRFTRYQL